MGNQLAQPQKLQPEHLAEIPNVVLKENLGMQRSGKKNSCSGLSNISMPCCAGGGRFLKSLLCVHDEGGQVVVKVGSPMQGHKQLEV